MINRSNFGSESDVGRARVITNFSLRFSKARCAPVSGVKKDLRGLRLFELGEKDPVTFAVPMKGRFLKRIPLVSELFPLKGRDERWRTAPAPLRQRES